MEKNLKMILFLVLLSQRIYAESEKVYCASKNNECGLNENFKSCSVNSSPTFNKENMTIEFWNMHNDMKFALEISNKEYYYIPFGIEKSFTNLYCLTIRNSKLKQVRRYNLEPFKDLIYLDLSYNHLSALEPNLFQHSTKLTTVWLNNNQIQNIDPTALIGLRNIRHFCFYFNDCYSFWSRNYTELMFYQNLSLCSNRSLKIYEEFVNLDLTRKIHELTINRANKYNLNFITGFTNLILLAVNSILIISLFCYLSSSSSSSSSPSSESQIYAEIEQ